jgi:ferredoxin-like protein FixX
MAQKTAAAGGGGSASSRKRVLQASSFKMAAALPYVLSGCCTAQASTALAPAHSAWLLLLQTEMPQQLVMVSDAVCARVSALLNCPAGVHQRQQMQRVVLQLTETLQALLCDVLASQMQQQAGRLQAAVTAVMGQHATTGSPAGQVVTALMVNMPIMATAAALVLLLACSPGVNHSKHISSSNSSSRN